MSETISAVIKPKGRIVVQFLEYFAPYLFPDKAELVQEAKRILEVDKERLKRQPLNKEQVLELLCEGYCKKFPELKNMLYITPDFKRNSQPYRIAFSSLDGNIDGTTFRLYGDLNPIETLRDNNVNFAIASSDLLLVKFVSLLPKNIAVSEPSIVLANLPYDTTTTEYQFPLKINQARHMLIMNFKPTFGVDSRGLPVLEDGTEIAVNGEYYLIYKYLFNGRYKLKEDKNVEPFVLQQNGKRKYGIAVVSSGDTLLEEVTKNGSKLLVFPKPIYESSAIILTNEERAEGRIGYKKIIGLIRELNQQISVPEKATEEYMKRNLARHLLK